MEQAAQLTDFVAKRPLVLTAGSASAPEWCAKQDRLAALSTDSAHHDIAGAVHEDLFAKQAGGARSSQAVPDVVSAVRTKAPLAKWRQRRNRGASRRPRPSWPGTEGRQTTTAPTNLTTQACSHEVGSSRCHVAGTEGPSRTSPPFSGR